MRGSGLLRISLVRGPVRAELLRTPSRLLSTEATETPLFSPSIVPTVVAVIGTSVAIAGCAFSIGSFYHSELARIEGLINALKSDIAGSAGKLEERMAGVMKEVDAKVSGAKETITKEVDAKNAGSEKTIDAKIAGYEKAADIKVRS